MEEGYTLANSHKEYCGDGLYYQGGNYYWVIVYDGAPSEVRGFWTRRDLFVEFLAEMSNYSCCGGQYSPKMLKGGGRFYLNNQRITKKRLEKFLVTGN